MEDIRRESFRLEFKKLSDTQLISIYEEYYATLVKEFMEAIGKIVEEELNERGINPETIIKTPTEEDFQVFNKWKQIREVILKSK